MKNKILFVALVIIALCLPIFAHADGSVTLSTSGDPTYARQGDSVWIYTNVHNNTDEIITVCSSCIYCVWSPLGAYDVQPGSEFRITDLITVDFLGGDYAVVNGLGIAYDIGYDNGNHELYGDDVVIHKDTSAIGNPPIDTSVFLDVVADDTSIEAGTWVNYTISCTNTGSTDYAGFTVFTSNQNIETFDLAVGETKIIYYSNQYFNNTTESFGNTFLYFDGSSWITVLQENAYMIDITVNPSATQAPASTPTPQPTNTPTPSPQPTSTPAPTSDLDGFASSAQNNPNEPSQPREDPSDDSNEQSNVISNTQDASKEQASAVTADANQKKTSTIKIILYIVCGLVVIGLFVILVILLKRLRDK